MANDASKEANADDRLLRAANRADLAELERALADGASVDARDSYGSTALNHAAEQGHLALVERLVLAGADIHNVGGADKTPLMCATFGGHVDVARFLLERGARVSNDLLASLQLKVNILEEGVENGMVTEEGFAAWKSFFEFMIAARKKEDVAPG